MIGGHDPDNRRDSIEFYKSSQTADKQEMFDWTKKWIKFRKDDLSLQKAKTVDLFYDNDACVFELSYDLVDWRVTTIIAFNNSNIEKAIKIPYFVSKRIALQDVSLKPIISDGGKIVAKDGQIEITVSPKSVIGYGMLP